MLKNRIQTAVFSLLKSEPYYAHFIMESRILLDAYGVPTAGAAVVHGTPYIIFNSEFCAKMTDTELTAILKHEVLHLLLSHTNTATEEGKDKLIVNIAMDCAINQYIKDLPAGGVTLEGLSKTVGKQLLPNETSDYYYAELMQKVKQVKQSGAGPMDDHDVNVPGKDTPEVAAGAVKRVANQALKKAAGKAPDHILSAIDKLADAKLPWTVLLRNAILSQVSRKTQATTKKINRRFALPVPGKKHKREMTLGVCIDESGSVSDEQLNQFMSEIKQISKMINKTYLVHADCQVAAVEDLSKVKFNPQRKAGGGTAYQPAIDECKKLKCNMIVYFGDFDTADKPENPGVPFLWVGVGNSPPPAQFGKVVRL